MAINKLKIWRASSLRAAAALPTILLIGGIVVEIGIALAFIIFFLGQSIFGVRASSDALAAARAGVQDATMQIVRNKEIGTISYALDSKTDVRICKNFINNCATPVVTGNKYDVISTGKVLTKNRRLEAILDVNDFTGEVKIESIKEIPL